MTTLAVQIDQIAEAFRRRLDAESVDFVRRYALHGESRLALETLCDYLCEEGVPIDPLV
ncbi:MafI family immunity protein [Variovorax sp. MHTC-1]|uniref:MafI family immunity protein n=1 Tax=Variovorax sp. MHTC-1 TaxID=2495593 RepID=UPI000F85DB21|nr:MafI family immunity protein [Variovorax sp. MHTC-1]